MPYPIRSYETSYACRWTTRDPKAEGFVATAFLTCIETITRTLFAIWDLMHLRSPIWRNKAHWKVCDSKTDEKIHSVLIDRGLKKPLVKWKYKFNVICPQHHNHDSRYSRPISLLFRKKYFQMNTDSVHDQRNTDAVDILNHSTIGSCYYDEIYFHYPDRYVFGTSFQGCTRPHPRKHFLDVEELPEELKPEEKKYVEVITLHDGTTIKKIRDDKIDTVLEKSGKKRAIITQDMPPMRYNNEKEVLFSGQYLNNRIHELYDVYVISDDEKKCFLENGEISDSLRKFLMHGEKQTHYINYMGNKVNYEDTFGKTH